MVVEELVEGGLTRLAVFYYSDTPDKVGPVRSMRASDVGIVQPVNGELVASGAAPHHDRRAAAGRRHDPHRGRDRASTATPAASRRTTCSSTSTSSPTSPARTGRRRSRRTSTFGDADDFNGDIPVKTVDASFSGGHTTNWEYGKDGWTRTDGYADERLRAPTTCCCCGSRSATPATSTRPATRFRRRSSSARAKACSCTATRR